MHEGGEQRNRITHVPILVRAESTDPEAVRAAVRSGAFEPPSDIHASSEYRRQVAEVVAARAVQQAEGRS